VKILVKCASIFLFWGNFLNGQYRADASLLFGQMKSHSSYTKELEAPVYGFQLDAEWEVPNEPRFPNPLEERKHALRYLGGTLLVMNMGLATTGYQYAAGVSVGAAQPFGKNFSLGWRVAPGLSYLTQKFDSITNPGNLAIGSHFNYLLLLSAYARLTAGRFGIVTGVNLTHCSNANYQKPNVGLNALNMNVGVSYRLHALSNPSQYYEAKSKFFAFPISAGLRMASRVKSMAYPRRNYVWIADWSYRNQKSKFSFWDVGLDGFYDPNYQWNDDGTLTYVKESENYELAVRGGKVFLYGRLGLRLDLGMYIVKPHHSEKPWFYNGLGLDYRLGHHWVAKGRIKAHLNKADYMEFGLSYLWR
jgi:hypothetical protein